MATIRSYTSGAITAGAYDGSITVADGSGFVVGARVTIASSLFVARVFTLARKVGNVLYFRDTQGAGFGTPDLSNYKVDDDIVISQLSQTGAGFVAVQSTPRMFCGTCLTGGSGFLVSAANTPTPPCDGNISQVGDIYFVTDLANAGKVCMFICTTAGYNICPAGSAALTLSGNVVNAGAWVQNAGGTQVYKVTTGGTFVGVGTAPSGTVVGVEEIANVVGYTNIGTPTTFPVAAFKTVVQV